MRAKKNLGLKPKGFARPKKGLGQNFLKSKQALRDIINAGEVTEKDIVLEIGPGKGALTEELLAHAGKVIAIEKDRELISYLEEKFHTEIATKKLLLIEDDILDFEFSTYNLSATTYKLIANIPYNITGAIIRKFLEEKKQPERMVLLVQKEVAERIVARPDRSGDRKESILSISVKAYGVPKIIAKVPARYFSPAPKVDSAIIAITSISKNMFTTVSERSFFEIIRSGFAHKRKVLIKNLEEGIGTPKEKLLIIWEQLKLSLRIRAEDLTLENWKELAQKLYN